MKKIILLSLLTFTAQANPEIEGLRNFPGETLDLYYNSLQDDQNKILEKSESRNLTTKEIKTINNIELKKQELFEEAVQRNVIALYLLNHV